jgi:hypothetical protein
MPDYSTNKIGSNVITTTAPIAATKVAIIISIVTSKKLRCVAHVIVVEVVLDVILLSASAEFDATTTTPTAFAKRAATMTFISAPLLPWLLMRVFLPASRRCRPFLEWNSRIYPKKIVT